MIGWTIGCLDLFSMHTRRLKAQRQGLFQVEPKSGLNPIKASTDKRFLRIVARMSIGILALMVSACTTIGAQNRLSGEACLEKEIQRLENLPEKKTITTLDQQRITLGDFSGTTPMSFPGCILPYKFYYWRNETKEVFSKHLHHHIKHQIRAYYNLTSTCFPEKREAARLYGDVAEFYDVNRTFMGFAVYLGQGLYCPLPYSGYEGSSSLEAAAIFRVKGKNEDTNLNERKEG